ncbi:CaiB/BaiF CoA transferase family protein [Rhodococcus jostii]|uniref:Formyl-CoA transferase n=1 Tax=Rhodococcus jostii TaxID=132919 RepID=A0A1H5D336_RHOJO|nr:CoA transferase [Rhodococcus jostii]SED73262.1 formyl-CoA transferase [Rhodococcus jostii]
MNDVTTGPLDGITVLELGNFIAAPFATRLLADFGAEVIKIERPDGGDELRGWRRSKGTTSMMYRTIARNKRSVTIDLKSSEGQQLVLDLAAEVDVVIENFRPGTLERWNIGPEQLQAANPDIVVVRISGYGQNGPYAQRAGFGGVAEAFGGLRYVTGYPDREPVRSAAPLGDTLAGLYGAVSALIMLLAKARSGDHQQPKVADVALYESVFMAMESLTADYDAYGMVRERTAGNLPGVVPSGSYPCADGSVLIAGNASGVFIRLMNSVGRPDLATDPDLVDGTKRYLREVELDEAIVSWTTTKSTKEVVAELSDAGIPVSEVFDAARIVSDEHYLARGMVRSFAVDVADGHPEKVRFPGVVPQFDGEATEVGWLGPDLGADTESVLSRKLGLTPDRLHALRTAGVI